MTSRLGITSTFEIAAAHHLPHHAGKCHRLHGHNYRLEFTRYGQPKPDTWHMEGDTRIWDSDVGMVADFGDFDAAIKAVLSHCTIHHYAHISFFPHIPLYNLYVLLYHSMLLLWTRDY